MLQMQISWLPLMIYQAYCPLFHHFSCPSSLASLASFSHVTFQMLESNCSRWMILATSESTVAIFWIRLFCRVSIVPLPIIPLICLQAITEVASSRNEASQVPHSAVSMFISLIWFHWLLYFL
jgi:hypothetical protein